MASTCFTFPYTFRFLRSLVVYTSSLFASNSPSTQSNRSLATPPDALLVCPGLGARTLGGVNDTRMFPIRGQTLLIRAPWVRFGRTISSKDGLWTYIIPRKSGDVVVGGTKEANDW